MDERLDSTPGFCLSWRRRLSRRFAGRRTMHSVRRGKVALCCMDGEGKHVIGDVNTQTVLEIYNAPAYRKMRQFTFSRKAAAAPCDTCIYP